MSLQAQKESTYTLFDVIDRILDKGLVINADIVVSVVGVELLGIKIRATLASFETAAKYGLEFPSGTNREMPVWQGAMVPKETCPQCSKVAPTAQLMEEECPWCGWVSAKAKGIAAWRGNGHGLANLSGKETR